jgi:hypothetical protein
MNKKIVIVISSSALLLIFTVLVIGGYFYLNKPKQTPEKNNLQDVIQSNQNLTEDIVQSAVEGTLPSINTNLLEDKPDLNPADKTNPFANIETNPFK